MKYLGIDHGRRSGIGIVKDGKFVKAGFFVLKELEYTKRLIELYNKVNELIDKYTPDVICLEKPSDMKNANTARMLVGYFTIAQLVAEMRGIKTKVFPPTTLKKNIAGHGFATKGMVCDALVEKYGIKKEDIQIPVYYKGRSVKYKDRIKEYLYDESDATALAFCGFMQEEKE